MACHTPLLKQLDPLRENGVAADSISINPREPQLAVNYYHVQGSILRASLSRRPPMNWNFQSLLE